MNIEHHILLSSKTVAVVGLSSKTDRPSYKVSSYLQQHGYRIIPVNPYASEILGEKCYSDISSIPEPVDMVNIFRSSEEVLPTVKEAIDSGVKYIWMQEGIVNQTAAKHATDRGIPVVMDKCTLKEHQRLST